MDYYAWYTYDLSDGNGRYIATVVTDEVRYYQGHQHGVRPSQTQLAALQVALYNAVLQKATSSSVPYPGNATVLAGAQLRTRSAH
jgi:hypothetical protein